MNNNVIQAVDVYSYQSRDFIKGNTLKNNIMIEKVRDFHRAFDHYVSDSPTLTPKGCDDVEALHDLRIKLIQEELDEMKAALAKNDLVELADAISDLFYVVAGAAVVYGIPVEECFDEVHDSNMTKLDEAGKPILNGINCPLDPSRPLGKVIKGPRYREPDLKTIIDRHIR